MESSYQFSRNVITTLHMVLLTSLYLYFHLITKKFGIMKVETMETEKPKKLTTRWGLWMNTLIISTLKERAILFYRYYRNHFEYNKETLLNQENVRNLSQKQKKILYR